VAVQGKGRVIDKAQKKGTWEAAAVSVKFYDAELFKMPNFERPYSHKTAFLTFTAITSQLPFEVGCQPLPNSF